MRGSGVWVFVPVPSCPKVTSARASTSTWKVVVNDIMMSATSITLAYRVVEMSMKQPARSTHTCCDLGYA